METDPFESFYHNVKIQEYNITYIKLGSGPKTIFCFPGALGTIRHYGEKFVRKFADEGDGKIYTFYMWDVPGYFKSSPPIRKFEDISLDFDASVAVELLKVLSPESKWIFMGTCGGAQTALKVATKYPGLVEKMVLWATWELFDDKLLYDKHIDLSKVDDKILTNRLKALGWSLGTYERHYTAWMDSFKKEYCNRSRADYAKQLSVIQCPTLLIAGTGEQIFELDHMTRLHKHITNSMLEILNCAPHYMFSSHPEEMYGLIHPFLQAAIN